MSSFLSFICFCFYYLYVRLISFLFQDKTRYENHNKTELSAAYGRK